mmetsp:Transcript_75788/g.157984  ORF Transcript_75788/g.157984 Transcript_75788/m.157984 type:complete len:86 (-) Transcript_75788:1840-2097(-)
MLTRSGRRNPPITSRARGCRDAAASVVIPITHADRPAHARTIEPPAFMGLRWWRTQSLKDMSSNILDRGSVRHVLMLQQLLQVLR